LADALAGCLLFYGLVSIIPAPYITGAYLIAIVMPLLISLDFNDFRIRKWKTFSILVAFLGAFSR
jgi:Ca2+/Na+ antiporter